MRGVEALRDIDLEDAEEALHFTRQTAGGRVDVELGEVPAAIISELLRELTPAPKRARAPKRRRKETAEEPDLN